MKKHSNSAEQSVNRKVLIAAAIFILIAIVISSIIFVRNSQRNAMTAANASDTAYRMVDACDVLTLEEAKAILGASATQQEHFEPKSEPGSISASSHCSYTSGQSDLSTMQVVSVSVNSPLSKDGEAANTTTFESSNGSAPLAGDQAVPGYGDKAFWSTKVHELSVLKDNMRIEITNGGSDQTTHTLDDAKKVADLVFKARS